MVEDVRQQIINSLFSKRTPSGVLEENYVSHLRISEEDDTGIKSRYILLAVDRHGAGHIYKSKQNNNATFSIGKTWKLEDLRGLEALTPTTVKIAFARSYRWQSDRERDQLNFLIATVRLFRQVTGNAPLTVTGFTVPAGNPQGTSRQAEQQEPPLSQTPTAQPALTQNISPRRLIRQPSNSSISIPSRTASPTLRRDRTQAQYFGNVALLDSQPSGPSTRPASPANLLPPSSFRGKDLNQNLRSESRTRNNFDPKTTESSKAPSRTTSPVRGGERARPSLETTSARPSFERERDRNRSREPPRDRARERVEEARPPPPPLPPPEPEPDVEELDRSAAEDSLRPSDRRYRNGATSRSASQARSLASQSQGRLRPPSPPSLPDHSPKRDANARISFFDPANQTTADRLLSNENDPGLGLGLSNAGFGDDEATEALMANVEEMLEGIEWGFDGGYGALSSSKGTQGAADVIEARLLEELMALEKANIHSFLESDDRIAIVMNYIDDAIKELDEMDGYISAYKVHLNAVGDDIAYIQSQDRGLQVQTQNQKVLLSELENLLQTLDVDREALVTLTQQSLENHKLIPKLEEAAAELYKALLAGRETGMAASIERLGEYKTHNAQFCKRVFEFLNIAFKFQSEKISIESERNGKAQQQKRKARPSLPSHEVMETYLGHYSGLMLYLKEMDEDKYSKVCATYFSVASDLHAKEMRTVLMGFINLVKKADDDGELVSFSPPLTLGTISRAGGTVRRAGTLVKAPIEARRERKLQLQAANREGDLRAFEALNEILEGIIPQIQHEESFIADFLQIHSASFTYADYMNLEGYLRHKASATSLGLRQTTIKLVRGAMELIFGFLPEELKLWIDGALQKDPLQVVGIAATIEQAISHLEDKSSIFLQRLLSKQHQRVTVLYNRHVDDQIKAIEQTKLNAKKRKGVAHFVKYFPVYMERVEAQLSVYANSGLEIRATVDAAYEKIIQAMFECLQQMAKMENADARDVEDKGQLNYHVILIENMHYFVAEVSENEMGAVSTFLKRAQTTYDENLESYVKLVVRRPLGKILDYFDGVERTLQTTAPSEVPNNPNYTKAALKRVLKDFNTKDMRRHIEAIFKRLEKHFAEDDTVSSTGRITPDTAMVDVWKACEDEVVRDTRRFMRLISQCYGDSGSSLEYTITDVEGAFKRHR